MPKFLAGFAAASALWGAGFALYATGVLTPGPAPEAVVAIVDTTDAGLAEAPSKGARRRRGRGGSDAVASAEPGGAPAPRGDALTGDDLGGNELRTLDLEAGGGEGALSPAQIGQTMDAVLPRIRRCLILAAGDEPVHGRLVFGLRVESSGRVAATNLSGPAAVTTGECGECLRAAVRAVQFPTFDGPPTIAHYPVTLE